MGVKDTISLRGRFRIVLFAVAASLLTQGAWAADPKVAFDIPAGDFSQAIIEFYKQSQVEILYASPGGVGDVKTRAVVGELEVSEALTKMLEGTGFTFEFENPRSVLLKRAQGEVPVMEARAADSPAVVGVSAAALTETAQPIRVASAPQIEDVVVTGTFIHGVFDIMSPLLRVEKKEMKSTGYATVRDALLTLPINSGAGPSDDFGGSDSNYNRGTAPNLRGLGYGATLVLVNGRRQPLAGSEADFVDTSNIPWSAVERIEVLPDGASALYGSDAIAGVINIIMREDLDGAETQARFASTSGDANEMVFAQLVGDHWDTGKWLLSYQFSEQNSLAASDRAYAVSEDKRPLGGTDHRSFWGSPGNILDPGTFTPVFGIPSGQDGTALEAADLLPGVVNLHDRFTQYDLAPDRKLHSVFLNASQKLGERLEFYGETRLGQRSAEQRQYQTDETLFVPATNAFFVDPIGGMPFVVVAYSFLDDLGPIVFDGTTLSYDGTLGMKADLGGEWRADALASYGREDMRWAERNMIDLDALDAALADANPATAFNPFGDGSHTNPQTLEAIRKTDKSQVVSDIRVASVVADGPLFSLPSGFAKLAVGAELREENLNHRLADSLPAQFGRNVSSAFAELSLPLVGKSDEPRRVPRLELSLAGRYEKFSDFGDTFNPKIGLRWAPVKWGKLRTSWGTSFKAPKLLDLYDASQNLSGMLLLQDPRSASGQSLVLVRQGNNPDLNDETARTWTLGLDLMPQATPGLTMSLTYYDIDYEDRILRPGPSSPFDILLQESQWAPVINRDPSRSQIDEICNSPDFLGSPVNCANSSPAAIIDYRLRNLAATKTHGIDLKMDYAVSTSRGEFGFGFSGNHVLSFKQALTRTAPLVDIVDTVSNPLAMRFRGNAEWYRHGRQQPGMYAGITVDHTGGYRDIEGQTLRHVDAYTSFDVRIAYRTAHGGGWLNDVEISLNAVNVLDAPPPFVDRSLGYDMLNSDPLGRLVSLYTQKSW